MNIAKPSFEKSAYPVEEMRFQQDLKEGREYVFNRFRYRWGGGRGVDGGITITLIKFCEIFFVRYFFLSLEKQLTNKKKYGLKDLT